jgi:hypothetical protein
MGVWNRLPAILKSAEKPPKPPEPKVKPKPEELPPPPPRPGWLSEDVYGELLRIRGRLA